MDGTRFLIAYIGFCLLVSIFSTSYLIVRILEYIEEQSHNGSGMFDVSREDDEDETLELSEHNGMKRCFEAQEYGGKSRPCPTPSPGRYRGKGQMDRLICEVFSPPRIARAAPKFGLEPGWSLDLNAVDPITGRSWDLLQQS